MLIVALAVLTLLSIIAVTFAALMRLERKATENFSNGMKTTHLGASAESRVIANLKSAIYWSGYTHHNELNTPWIYGIKTRRGEQQLGGLMPLETASPDEVSFAGDLGASYSGGLDRYKVKVIDTASQININGRQDSLATMIDNLGIAIKSDERFKTAVNPLHTQYPNAGKLIKGADIIRYRNKLEGNRFHSKAQLKSVIGAKNYALLADFVTTQGWEDQTTYRGSDGQEEFNNPFSAINANQGNLPGFDPTDANTGLATPVTGSQPRVIHEPRFPININTAPRPVLIAAIAGLGGRRAFPFVQVERMRIEERNRGEIDLETGTLPPGNEEVTLRQVPVWVYTQPFTVAEATRIADRIISFRKAQPFTQWSTGMANPKGFVEFVNTELLDGDFPIPQSVRVVAPDFPRDPKYGNEIRSQSTASGMMFSEGHAAGEASVRRQRGMSYSGQFAWYYDLVRGVLLANFNPNSRINRWNPNSTAYQAVDKANLVKLGGTNNDDPTIARPGHTTEFCFDSNGVFEITTLAEMKGAGAEVDGGNAAPTYAETRRRSIVKIWETLRHTTQFDFEQPFTAAGFSSRKDRTYVTTFPDPMRALQDDLFFGSEVDGRVELSGYYDALREVQPSTIRNQFFQGRQNVLLHHGFKFRDDTSRQRLRSLARDSKGSEAYVAELRKVLDPAYSRSGGSFRRRYSRDNWGGLSDSNVVDKQINDPIIESTSRGSDLFPDGINSSMLRNGSLTARFLRFPASKYRANPKDQGALNRTYRNEIGNVAYYSGGVAFWVKFEFDGDDPVFSGLVGATQVQTKVGLDPTASEGTQFYVYKNTQGQLRISRLYYHQAFQEGNTGLAVPRIGDGEEEEGGGSSEEELVDARKRWARTDVLVDIKNWRAREWHHVAVQYNDEITANRVRVLLDFEDVDAIAHNLGETQFCALNVEEPKDVLFVGGFFRDQAVATEGLFKFGTNYSKGVTLREPSVKRVVANATVDEFVSFANNYSAPYGVIGYFTDKNGIYSNRFQIPLPEGIQRVRLRSFAWTMYPPTMYSSAPVSWSTDRNMEASVANIGNGGQSKLPMGDAGGESTRNQALAGRWVYATGTVGGRVAEVVYQFRMGAGLGSGKYGSSTVASPVLDDVTLTYFLPSTQVLLSEAVE